MPEVRSGTQFMVADAYWVPPQGEPIGPMVLEVSLIALKRYVEDSK
jgi:hypothetical protein